MNDLEQKLFFALLKSDKIKQRQLIASSRMARLFRNRRKEYAYLKSVFQSEGALPTVARYNARFSNARLEAHTESLSGCIEMLDNEHLLTSMSSIVNRAKAEIAKGASLKEVAARFRAAAAGLSSADAVSKDVFFTKSWNTDDAYRRFVHEQTLPQSSLIETPWRTINKAIIGFVPGNLLTIVARMGMGKSWCVIYYANYLRDKGYRVLFISKEMTTDEVLRRADAIAFKLPYSDLRAGLISPKKLRQFREERAGKKWGPGELIINDDETVTGMSLDDVVYKVQEHRPYVVFIDGAYLLTIPDLPKNASYADRLRLLSNRLKALAKALKVVFVAVLQLNRDAEKQSGVTTGGIKNVYGGDSLAQDSDALWSIHGVRGSASRIITLEKSREGAVGDVPIKFQLTPYPDFSQIAGAASVSGGNIEDSDNRQEFKPII